MHVLNHKGVGEKDEGDGGDGGGMSARASTRAPRSFWEGAVGRTCTNERIASTCITTQAILLPDQRRDELRSR
jgi:hypothetical protein